MKFADRIEKLPPYLFAQISKKVAAKKAEGIDVISFGIGDPDLPTPPHILDALAAGLARPRQPPLSRDRGPAGLPPRRRQLVRAPLRRPPRRRQGESSPLIGSKEGIGHVALCFIDPGDVALVPDPATPSTRSARCSPAARRTTCRCARRTASCRTSTPSRPTSPAARRSSGSTTRTTRPAPSPTSTSSSAPSHFAKRHDIAVCHDGPYSEVAYDGYRPVSFLQAKGAMDVGVEFHSLSKSYNMTGWRIGMAAGNPKIVDALMRVKSNIDSGVAQAVQRMAIAALEGPQDTIAEHNAIYQRRRDRVVDALRRLGLHVTPPKASLYVWARVPDGMTSAAFAERLLDEAAVIVTPGNGYGAAGEGYVRLSLTLPDDRVDEGLRRIAALPALA